MKCYKLQAHEEAAEIFYGTLADAHAEARDSTEPVFRVNVRITEVEVPTDKAGVIALLNGYHKLKGQNLMVPSRVWCLTARGGLKEITPEPEDVGTPPHQ